MKILFILTMVLALMACSAGDGTGLDDNGQPLPPNDGTAEPDTPDEPPADPTPPPSDPVDPDALQPTLASIQEKILTPICTQCHIGNNAPLGLGMDNLDTSIANLIDVDSATSPTFKRVEPGNPDASFFYLKIIGDPIAGAQMPLGQSPLPQAQQQVIREWILAGAPIDSSTFTLGKQAVVSRNGGITLTLSFSQSVDPSSLSKADLSVVSAQQAHVPLSDGYELHWQNPKKAQLQLSPSLAAKQPLSITFNQDQVHSVWSQSGNLLDGDQDGKDGGAFRYEITGK